jgi:hypothetical protein
MTGRIRTLGGLLALSLGMFAIEADAQKPRNVMINGDRISIEMLRAYEARYRVHVADGAYWYDGFSGAWGVQGGPTVGFIAPGLPIGGKLKENASNGRTGVWVNGRQLHWMDVVALSQIVRVLPGRFWVDANGIGGWEGMPASFNLRALASQSGRGGAWSYHSKYGGSVGGDGNFVYYIDSKTSMTSQ